MRLLQPSHLLFAAILVVIGVIHWRIVASTPYPAGLDGGNWLALGHGLLGDPIRSTTIVYPPVVPLLAVTLENAFGTYTGLQVLAIASSVAPAVGLYVLLYAWGANWRAAVAASFLAAAAGTTEAMAWGGYPQLIALGLLPVFILSLDVLVTGRHWLRGIAPGVLLGLIVATSPPLALISVAVGAAFLPLRYWGERAILSRGSISGPLVAIAITVLCLASLVPVYAALIPGLSTTEQARQTHINALSAFTNVTVELPPFWWIGLLLVPGSIALYRTPQRRFSIAAILIVSACFAVLFAIGEPRAAYFIPSGIAIAVAAFWFASGCFPTWVHRTADVAVIACLLLDVVIGAQYAAVQRNYYTVVNPGVAAGLAQLDSISRPDMLIAVSPGAHNWDIGWWVEGVARRPSIYAGDPVWLTFQDEKDRNVIANRIFEPTLGSQQALQRARDAGAGYLFIDKDWDGANRFETRLEVANGAVNIVFENESVLIVSSQPLQGTQ
jgi:hypothetical protein